MIPPTKPEHIAADRPHAKNHTEGTQGNRQDRIQSALNLLSRLTVNEWLTLLVAIGSLVVSYLTYRTASDTSDLKAAVTNLGNLAADTKRQANATEKELGEMSDQQRPWVKEVAGAASDLVFNQYGGRITILTRITNVGHSPAIAAADLYKFVLQTSNVDPLKEQKKLCDPARNYAAGTNGLTQTLFPGDSFQSLNSLPIDMKNQKEALARDGDNFVSIYFVGCADYIYEGKHHQTGFIYTLNRTDDPTRKAGFGIDPRDGNIAQKDVILGRVYGYGYYID